MVVSGGSLGGDILVSFSDVRSAYVVLYDFQTCVKRIPSISGVSYHLSGSLEMTALGISSAPPPASRTIESRIRLSKSTRSINRTYSHRMK
jgi:hypothetical protein